MRLKFAPGVIGVPAAEVSVMVTVQVEELGKATGLVQVIVVLLVRKLTVMLNTLLTLLLWVESPT